MPVSHASVSSSNGWLKSGSAKTGVCVMASFNLSNASCAMGLHKNCFFLKRLVNGLAIIP